MGDSNVEGDQLATSSFRLENYYTFDKVSESEFVGRKPLSSIKTTGKLAYGGDLMCQCLLVAWSTVEGDGFTPHSFHAYFLKAGRRDIPLSYEVHKMSDGRNFANRTISCFDKESGKQFLSVMISFTKNNSQDQRYEAYKKGLVKQPPFYFQVRPPPLFYRYKDNLDALATVPYGVIDYYVPKEYFKHEGPNPTIVPERRFGFFFKPSDDITLAKDRSAARILTLIFCSDSFYMITMERALGQPLFGKNQNFFKVSLDHAIFFHEADFDDTGCLFFSYSYPRLNNDRIQCHCQVFDGQGVHIVTIVQEALVYWPQKVIEQANGGTARL